MRLSCLAVGGETLTLDLATEPGVARGMTLHDITGLEGRLATGARTELREARATSATLSNLEWMLPGARILGETPIALAGATADMVFAGAAAVAEGAVPVEGAAGLESARTERLTVEVGERRVAFGLELAGIRYRGDAEGTASLEVARATVTELQLALGRYLVRVPRVELSQVALGMTAGGASLSVGGASAPSATIAGPGLELELSGLSLSDARARGRDVDLGSLSVEGARARIAPAEPSATAAGPKGKRVAVGELVDRRLLDFLDGHLRADLDVDLTVPILGRRQATHRLRLPVSSGIISFADLEDGLATLEDALIDFAVRGDELWLERDLPLMDPKPIVTWPLQDAAELDLASRKRVRLRRLLDGRMAAREPGKKPKIALRRLMVDDIDVALAMSPARSAVSLDGQTAEIAGAVPRMEFASLSLSGEFHHVPEGDTQTSELRGTLRELDLALLDLPVAGQRLSVDQLAINLADLAVSLRDLRTTAMDVECGGVAIRGATLRGGDS